MGVGKLDEAATPESEASSQLGLLLTLREGDVIVHPAGTGHSNVSDEGRYRYLSFFPEVCVLSFMSVAGADGEKWLAQVDIRERR